MKTYWGSGGITSTHYLTSALEGGEQAFNYGRHVTTQIYCSLNCNILKFPVTFMPKKKVTILFKYRYERVNVAPFIYVCSRERYHFNTYHFYFDSKNNFRFLK